MKNYVQDANGEYDSGSTHYPSRFKDKIENEVILGEATLILYVESEDSDLDKVAEFRQLVSVFIDSVPQSMGYDSVLSAVSYAVDNPITLDEVLGSAIKIWRRDCWDKCRADLAAWLGGGSEPTIEEIISGLPVFVSPVKG